MSLRVGVVIPVPVALALASPFKVSLINSSTTQVVNASAVQIRAGGGIVVSGCNFTRNYLGSCLRLNASRTTGMHTLIQDTSFTDCNTVLGNYPIISASQGGGAYVDLSETVNATLRLAGATTFFNCTASEGGGLYVFGANSTGATVRFTGATTFRQNHAIGTATVGHGGGCILKFGSEYYLGLGYIGDHNFYSYLSHLNAHYILPTISFEGAVLFEANTAMWEAGGCLLRLAAVQNATVSMTGNVTFRSNHARGHGGGLSIDLYTGLGDVTMEGVSFVNNTAVEHAGGVDINTLFCKCTLIFAGGSLEANVAVRGAGGGMRLVLGSAQDVVNQADVAISKTVFRGNAAASSTGGGLYMEGSSTLTFSCRDLAFWFDCDTAHLGVNPALVFLVRLTSNLFEGNQAVYGGAMLLYNTLALVESSVFVGNKASVLGGAVFTKSMLRLTMKNISAVGNSAGQQGGAIYSAISDGFSWHLIDIINSSIAGNAATTQGGGVYIQGGIADIQGTNITDNQAGSQGGGLVFADVCSTQHQGTCILALHEADGQNYFTSNRIEGNSAFTGGGVFIITPPNSPSSGSVNTSQLHGSARGNQAVYAAELSLPPKMIAVQRAMYTAASSTDLSGLVPVEVDVGEEAVRVQVDWCENSTTASNGVSLVGGAQKSDELGHVAFSALRLLNAKSETVYCLQVRTPDYPATTPTDVLVHIRGCVAGEFREAGVGCTLCPPNTYSFDPDEGCLQCPADANCTGGAVLIPAPGHWHAGPTSARVQPCPNQRACQGSRALLHQCRAEPALHAHAADGPRDGPQPMQAHVGGTESYVRCSTPADYTALQCTYGYRGNLCGSCDRARNFGQRSFFRCGRCMGKAGSLALLLAAACVAVCVVAFVALRALMEGRQLPHEAAGLSAPVNNEELYGSFKVLVLYLQYLGIIGQLLVDWPKVVRILMRGVYFLFATSGPQIISLDCLGIGSNFLRMLLQLLLPLLVVACATCVLCTLIHARKILIYYSTTPRDAAIVCTIIGVYLFYTQLVTTVLSAFSCISYGSASYWVRDMDVRCWTAEHTRSSLALGIAGSALLCAALPLATMWCLVKNWQNHNKTFFRTRYAFLYRMYTEQYCYWEGVICASTITVVCVQLFARRHGPLFQLILLVLLLTIMSTLVQSLRPFRSKRLHKLFLAGNLTLLLTCLGVMCMLRGYSLDSSDSTSLRTTIAALLILANSAFIALCLYVMARSMWAMVKNCSRASRRAIRRFTARFIPAPLRGLSRKAEARRKARAAPTATTTQRNLWGIYSVNSTMTASTVTVLPSVDAQLSVRSLPSSGLSALPSLNLSSGASLTLPASPVDGESTGGRSAAGSGGSGRTTGAHGVGRMGWKGDTVVGAARPDAAQKRGGSDQADQGC